MAARPEPLATQKSLHSLMKLRPTGSCGNICQRKLKAGAYKDDTESTSTKVWNTQRQSQQTNP